MAPKKNRSALLSALSNFTIQFNYQAATVALLFMQPFYPRSETEESLLKCMVFIGSIFGQLTMGYAGDLWGRRRAMIVTSLFVVVGALGSALTTWGSATDVYSVLTFWRFILGFGVGGKYPLSATMRSEGTDAGQHTSTEVARGFFWQTPGTVAPYLLGMLLCAVYGQTGSGFGTEADANVQFRIVLGCGAIPSIISTWLLIQEPESEAFVQASKQSTKNPLRVALDNPELWPIVLGTGLSWFLFDIVIYGCSFNQPSIMEDVFGQSDTHFRNFYQNALVNCISLTGIVVGVLVLEKVGSKPTQFWGFLAVAASAAALAVSFKSGGSPWLNFALYSLLTVFLNWGPNISTYVLPTEVYPTAVRSSLFGLSAAMGKTGATLGSYSFKPIESAVGDPWLFGMCAMISLVAMVVTHMFIPPYGKGSKCAFCAPQEEEDGGGETAKEGLLNSA